MMRFALMVCCITTALTSAQYTCGSDDLVSWAASEHNIFIDQDECDRQGNKRYSCEVNCDGSSTLKYSIEFICYKNSWRLNRKKSESCDIDLEEAYSMMCGSVTLGEFLTERAYHNTTSCEALSLTSVRCQMDRCSQGWSFLGDVSLEFPLTVSYGCVDDEWQYSPQFSCWPAQFKLRNEGNLQINVHDDRDVYINGIHVDTLGSDAIADQLNRLNGIPPQGLALIQVPAGSYSSVAVNGDVNFTAILTGGEAIRVMESDIWQEVSPSGATYVSGPTDGKGYYQIDQWTTRLIDNNEAGGLTMPYYVSTNPDLGGFGQDSPGHADKMIVTIAPTRFYDFDIETGNVYSAGHMIRRVHFWNSTSSSYQLATKPTDIEVEPTRSCGASLIHPHQFAQRQGIPESSGFLDRIFAIGWEVSNGGINFIQVDTGDYFITPPQFAGSQYELAFEVTTFEEDHIALVLCMYGSSNPAYFALYIGKKNAESDDFMERNGLIGGSLYALNEAGDFVPMTSELQDNPTLMDGSSVLRLVGGAQMEWGSVDPDHPWRWAHALTTRDPNGLAIIELLDFSNATASAAFFDAPLGSKTLRASYDVIDLPSRAVDSVLWTAHDMILFANDGGDFGLYKYDMTSEEFSMLGVAPPASSDMSAPAMSFTRADLSEFSGIIYKSNFNEGTADKTAYDEYLHWKANPQPCFYVGLQLHGLRNGIIDFHRLSESSQILEFCLEPGQGFTPSGDDPFVEKETGVLKRYTWIDPSYYQNLGFNGFEVGEVLKYSDLKDLEDAAPVESGAYSHGEGLTKFLSTIVEFSNVDVEWPGYVWLDASYIVSIYGFDGFEDGETLKLSDIKAFEQHLGAEPGTVSSGDGLETFFETIIDQQGFVDTIFTDKVWISPEYFEGLGFYGFETGENLKLSDIKDLEDHFGLERGFLSKDSALEGFIEDIGRFVDTAFPQYVWVNTDYFSNLGFTGFKVGENLKLSAMLQFEAAVGLPVGTYTQEPGLSNTIETLLSNGFIDMVLFP